jgi:hypothetical protein
VLGAGRALLLLTLGLVAVLLIGLLVLGDRRWLPVGHATTAGRGAHPAADPVRIERDRTGRCIPAHPERELPCDPVRAAFWEDRAGAMTELLRSRGLAEPTPAEVLAARLQLRADAGDLVALAELARGLGLADVRIVAVALLPADPAREYAEVQNRGVGARELDGLVLERPLGEGSRLRAWFLLGGRLLPGAMCRVYSQPAGQPDACEGSWRPAPGRGPWPRLGGWVALQALGPGAAAGEVDRWYYRPEA